MPRDRSDEAVLSYNRLRAVIDAYESCPVRLRSENNNSDNFKTSIELSLDHL